MAQVHKPSPKNVPRRKWIGFGGGKQQWRGVLLADGFEQACLGATEVQPGRPALAVYDAEKCIDLLRQQGMTYPEAYEYFSFNVVESWVGEGTPVFLWRATDETTHSR